MAQNKDRKKPPAAYQASLTRFYYQYAARLVAELGVYNPSSISFASLKRMREYPQIHFGLAVIKMAVLAAEKRVVCDDADVRRFVESQYLRPWSERFTRMCLNALDFGYAPVEHVWTSADYHGATKWVFRELRDPHPENCRWLADERGSYKGFQQLAGDIINVPADKSAWYAHDDEFGNLYGTPATKSCYRAWYNHEMLTLFMLREAERFGTPFVKVKYPPDTGDDVTNRGAAQTLGRDVRDNSYVTLPQVFDDGRNPLWDVDVVPPAGDGSHWVGKLDYFNVEMFRALRIPDRVVTQGEVGAYKQAEVHSKFFTKTTDGIAGDVLRAENEHNVKKLVQYNFAKPPTCYLEAEPLSDDKREFILELCRDILASNADRRTVEACRDKVAQMGLKMPEETPASPPPATAPDAPPEEEPMPKGEGDVAETIGAK